MTRLGLGLLLVGAITIIVTSGAFESIEAERGTNIGTATDEDALLKIEYPRLEDPEFDSIKLSGGCTFFGECNYHSVEMVSVSDNIDGETIEDLSVDAMVVEGDDLPSNQGPNWPHMAGQIENGAVTVTSDFECEDAIIRQYGASATIEITIEATGSDGVSIVLSREIVVDCVSDFE